jgi:hypothetical protein
MLIVLEPKIQNLELLAAGSSAAADRRFDI